MPQNTFTLLYKSAGEYIITLQLLPESVHNIERKNVVNKEFASFRCDCALVLDISHKLTFEKIYKIYSDYDTKFCYEVGKSVTEKNFNKNLEYVGVAGIHFYLNKECAFFHNLSTENHNGLYRIWFNVTGELDVECIYKDGKRDGLHRSWRRDGQWFLQMECTFKDGKEDGLHRQWYENGQLMWECIYKDDKKNGLDRKWYENGQLKAEFTYKYDKMDGLCRDWYENGQLETEYTYKNGKKGGLYRFWYENGQLWEECTYKDNKRDGLYRSWYENGQLEEERAYKDGKTYGLYRSWYENGQLDDECTYEDDVPGLM